MADLTIYGAGIIGLSIAWIAQSRGARVHVVDPNGVAAGASGGIVGALAPHVPENWNSKKQFQLESLTMGTQFWAEVDAVSGLSSGYDRLGRVQPIPDEAALNLAKIRGENAMSLWPNGASWTVSKDSGVWDLESPTGYFILDTLSGRINPKAACLSLAHAIESRGGVFDTVPPSKPMGAQVWATGLHDLERISKTLPRTFGNGVKGQAVLFEYDVRDAPQLFVNTLHFVPHRNGTLAIGSTSERDYCDPLSTDQKLEDIIDQAYQILPQLKNSKLLRRWAGVRPRSRSRAPVVGVHPLNKDAYIANGGFKIGFGMAPKIAQVLVDLILEGHDTIPPEFHPDASL